MNGRGGARQAGGGTEPVPALSIEVGRLTLPQTGGPADAARLGGLVERELRRLAERDGAIAGLDTASLPSVALTLTEPTPQSELHLAAMLARSILDAARRAR